MASEDAILMGSFRDPNARSVEPATFDSSIDEVQSNESLDDLRSRYDELLESSPVVEAEPKESESGFTNQLLGSLERTLAVDNPRLGGRAIEGLGRLTGIESMQEFGEKIVSEFDQSDNPDEFVPRVSSYKDFDGLQSFLDYAGSTLGQGLGSLGVVVGGGAAGAAAGSAIPGAGTAAGAVVGATGSGFLLNYGDTYEYLVEQEGMDPNDAAPYALIPAAAMAVLDTAGVGFVLKPVKDTLKKNLVKRTAQLALRGAGSESLTETGQQVIQESAGEMAEALGLAKNDIVASQRFENIANAFLGSLLPGGVFGAASAPLQRPVDKPDDTQPSKPEPEPEPEPDDFGIPPFSPNEEFLTDENIDQIKKIVRPGYAYFTNSVGSQTQAPRAKKLGGVNVIGQGIAESGLLFNERNKGLRIRPFMYPLGAMEDADGTSVVERLKEAVERGNYLRNAPLTFVYELPIGDVPFQSKVVDGTTIYPGRDDVILNAAKALGLPGTELATAAAASIKEQRGVSRGRDLNRVMPPEFIKGVFVNGQLMTLDDYKASLGLDIDKGSAVEASASVAQSEENAPDAAPLPVVESEPVRVTAALTGVQDARDDMKKLKKQFLDISNKIVAAEKRGDDTTAQRLTLKSIENTIFDDFEAGLRSLLERDGDIEIVSFERGLGGWAGQELEPNLRIEVSGDKDTVLSRITEFNQTSGMSGPNAVPQGGALNRILFETIEDGSDVIDFYDAANVEENKKLVWDDNGAERLATLQIDLPAEMLTPESLASLGSVFAKRSLGFTVDRKNNRIELIHTPEWSETNAQDTLNDFVEAARNLQEIARQNYGSEVAFRWIKEEIQISAPESDVINIKNGFSDVESEYRVVSYKELRKDVQDEYRRRDSGTVRDRSGSEGQEDGSDTEDSGRTDAGESGVSVEAIDDATQDARAEQEGLAESPGDAAKPPTDLVDPNTKVVDESGNPLIVYHGGLDVSGEAQPLRKAGPGKFEPSKSGSLGAGVYFSPSESRAYQYAVDFRSPDPEVGAAVTPAYLNIVNPLVLKGTEHPHPVIEAFIKLGKSRDDAIAMVERIEEEYGYIRTELQKEAKKKGYDGIIQYDKNGESISEIVLFDPNKAIIVKSKDLDTPVAEPDPLLEQRIEEAAEAGSKTKKEAREAARLWKEKGILSKYFKRWFGKSVLVDSKGNPVRLFHGTDRVFDVFAEPEAPGLFGQGIYTTFLPYVADEYTSKFSSTEQDSSLRPNIIPGYVSIQNPIFTKEPADPALIEEAKTIAASFSRKLYLPKGDLTTFDDLLLALDDVAPDRRRYTNSQRKLRLKMEKLGYDGMINASKESFEKAQKMDFKNTSVFDDIPRDMHVILLKSSQFKSDIGNLGTFDPLDPRIQYGLTGAAIPAAAALQDSDDDEGEGEGNPLAEDFEGPFIYNETRDYSGVSEMVNTMRDAQSRYEDLLSEINIIEAEYTSLSQEDRDGDRGRLLEEWHDKTLDEYSNIGDFIDESAYTRFLMGSDVYFDTEPTDIRGFDERRGFNQVGLTDEPMTMDISTRRKQENEQRFKLQKTIENGGPYVDFFGKLGDLNKYLYKKASFFQEPVQTVQLNGHEKRMLYSDEVNLKQLYDSGLISYLLYRELVGDVELL